MGAPGLVRKAMRNGRASTGDGEAPTFDAPPDQRERRLLEIANLEDVIRKLPACPHKADLVAELNRLKREN